jgi:hypothetical protein
VGFFTKFLNNFSNIEGIVVNVIAMAIFSAISTIVGVIIRKNFKPKPPEVTPIVSSDQAIRLNEPKKPLDDDFFDRNDTLRDVFETIKGEEPRLFVKNHVSIVGREGIGKTHFCQFLFKVYLKKSKIYVGWIECDGEKSIFEIIKEDFINTSFKGKNKETIKKTIENLDRPCVFFIDQVDQHAPFDEIDELITYENTSIVVSGSLKRIGFVQNQFTLEPLTYDIVRAIFEKKSKEVIDLLERNEERAIKTIIDNYVKGNPFLAVNFARAKAQNENSWDNVLKNMYKREYYGDGDEEDYITNILKQLYKVGSLNDDERSTLSKLCIFSSLSYTAAVFEFSNIPMNCISQLCKTYWLTRREGMVFYCIDEVHRDALRKVLPYKESLRELITSVAAYIGSWKVHEDKGFGDILPYIEDILKNVKRFDQGKEYTAQLMNDPNLFARFAYLIADKYHFAIKNDEKALEWLGYCNPTGITLPEDFLFTAYKNIQKGREASDYPGDISELPHYFSETSSTYYNIKQTVLESLKKEDISKLQLDMLYKKAVLEYIVKLAMLNSPVKPFEVEEAYSIALSLAENFDDFEEKQKYLQEEYCVFLSSRGKYDEVKSLCKEHFDVSGFALDDDYSCTLFYRYLSAAYDSNDEELIESLVRREILDALWSNSELVITVAWSFGLFYKIFNKKGNDETAELCKRRMVILINRQKCFWHPDIRNYIELSDEKFIEYMYSHEDLWASLNEAIDRQDAEALYLEGRYREKHREFNEAFSFYEQSAEKNNLKGICSLALMYYRGPEYYNGLEEPQDFKKARAYWEYCNEGEKKHRGSHYWLGIMLMDGKYEGYDKELAIQHLKKAEEMGSKGAREKLRELDLLSISESKGEQP